MQKKALNRAEVKELRDQLAAVLREVDNDGLHASAGMRHRIEGAVVALAVFTGHVDAEVVT